MTDPREPAPWPVPQSANTINRDTLDRLFTATYDELRRLAGALHRSSPATSLSPTTLVNEAWLKLSRSSMLTAVSVTHFKRIAARAMRQVMVEAARRRTATKRGGGRPTLPLELGEAATVPVDTDAAEQVVAIDAALLELAEISARQAAVVEARFFGGMEVAEVASALGVSEATVHRDWRVARAWLGVRLGDADPQEA